MVIFHGLIISLLHGRWPLKKKPICHWSSYYQIFSWLSEMSCACRTCHVSRTGGDTLTISPKMGGRRPIGMAKWTKGQNCLRIEGTGQSMGRSSNGATGLVNTVRGQFCQQWALLAIGWHTGNWRSVVGLWEGLVPIGPAGCVGAVRHAGATRRCGDRPVACLLTWGGQWVHDTQDTRRQLWSMQGKRTELARAGSTGGRTLGSPRGMR